MAVQGAQVVALVVDAVAKELLGSGLAQECGLAGEDARQLNEQLLPVCWAVLDRLGTFKDGRKLQSDKAEALVGILAKAMLDSLLTSGKRRATATEAPASPKAAASRTPKRRAKSGTRGGSTRAGTASSPSRSRKAKPRPKTRAAATAAAAATTRPVARPTTSRGKPCAGTKASPGGKKSPSRRPGTARHAPREGRKSLRPRHSPPGQGHKMARVLANCSEHVITLSQQSFGVMVRQLKKYTLGDGEVGFLRTHLLALRESPSVAIDSYVRIDLSAHLLLAYMSVRALAKQFDRQVRGMGSPRRLELLRFACAFINRILSVEASARSELVAVLTELFGAASMKAFERNNLFEILGPFLKDIVEELIVHTRLELTSVAAERWARLPLELLSSFTLQHTDVAALARHEAAKAGARPSPSPSPPPSPRSPPPSPPSPRRAGEGGEATARRQTYAPEDATQGGIDLGSGEHRVRIDKSEWSKLFSSSKSSDPEETGAEAAAAAERDQDDNSALDSSALNASCESSVGASSMYSGRHRGRRISFPSDEELQEVHDIPKYSEQERDALFYSMSDLRSFLIDAADDAPEGQASDLVANPLAHSLDKAGGGAGSSDAAYDFMASGIEVSDIQRRGDVSPLM